MNTLTKPENAEHFGGMEEIPGRSLLPEWIEGMANRQRSFSKAELREARRLYEETNATRKSIAAMLGITPQTLRGRIPGWGWKRALTAAPPAPEKVAANPVAANQTLAEQALPQNWQGNPCTGLSACPERSALISKLWASVSRQITRIDAAHGEFVRRGAPNAGEAEGYAKLIATLARSLRELAALDASLQEKSQQDQATHDISAGNNPDALRDELAKRLAALETGTPQTIAGEPDAAGN